MKLMLTYFENAKKINQYMKISGIDMSVAVSSIGFAWYEYSIVVDTMRQAFWKLHFMLMAYR